MKPNWRWLGVSISINTTGRHDLLMARTDIVEPLKIGENTT
jgi:hypothetical protein